MIATLKCTRCGHEQPAEETLTRCACGSRGYRIMQYPDAPPGRHSFIESSGAVAFTAPRASGDAHGP